MTEAISSDPKPMRLAARLHFGDRLMLGPGKAELLERIRAAGSIAAAGRGMGMSYKRAWLLVEDMNRAFGAPVVDGARGGSGGGGATLTDLGTQVLHHYRAFEAAALAAGAADIAAIAGLLDISERK